MVSCVPWSVLKALSDVECIVLIASERAKHRVGERGRSSVVTWCDCCLPLLGFIVVDILFDHCPSDLCSLNMDADTVAMATSYTSALELSIVRFW